MARREGQSQTHDGALNWNCCAQTHVLPPVGKSSQMIPLPLGIAPHLRAARHRLGALYCDTERLNYNRSPPTGGLLGPTLFGRMAAGQVSRKGAGAPPCTSGHLGSEQLI